MHPLTVSVRTMHNGSTYQVSVPFIRDAGLDMTAIRALGELCSYSAVEAGKEVFAQACMCHVYDMLTCACAMCMTCMYMCMHMCMCTAHVHIHVHAHVHVHGMCTAWARHVHGMCTACARHGHGMCMACARHVHGMSTACARHGHGICTAWARRVHGMCTWRVHGRGVRARTSS